MASSDSDTDASGSSSKFTGSKPEKWDGFQKKILRKLKAKVGTREMAEAMWWGLVPDLQDAAQCDDKSLSDWKFKALACVKRKNHKLYKEYLDSESDFHKRDKLHTWYEERFGDMYDMVEARVSGQAETKLESIDRDQARTIRAVLFKKFGGSSEDILAREERFEACMPAQSGGPAFPPGCDIEVKLSEMYAEWRRLIAMCPPDKRDQYEHGKETTLVKAIMKGLEGTEYQGVCKKCVERVLADKRVEAMLPRKDSAGNVVLADPAELKMPDYDDWAVKNYSLDWLPTYQHLETKLIAHYKELKYKRTPDAKDRTPNATAMINPGFGSQNTDGQGKGPRCWGCGEWGHRRGDPVCKAAAGAIHESAPKRAKESALEASMRGGKGSGGRGNGRGGRGNSGRGQGICRSWASTGKCRFGDKCRYLHEKSSSGSTVLTVKAKSRLLKKERKKERKRVIEEVKSKLKKSASKRQKQDANDSSDGDLSMLDQFLMVKTIPRETRNPQPVSISAMAVSTLHDLNFVADDSASSRSITSERSDFLWVNETENMKNSVTINGPSTGTPGCGGIGPIAYRVDAPGRNLIVIDPDGIFAVSGPRFRILSAQQMASLGVKSDTGVYDQAGKMKCTKSGEEITLTTRNDILVFKTKGAASDIAVSPALKRAVSDVRTGLRSPIVDLDELNGDGNGGHQEAKVAWRQHGSKKGQAMLLTLMTITCLMNPSSILLNESKLKVEEISRLMCRRFGFCDTNKFAAMKSMPEYGDFAYGKARPLNEDVFIQNAAKAKRKSYPRNSPDITMNHEPWWRSYCDGYGGQGSLGGTSYEGATGAYLFVCPSSGAEHLALYASGEQFAVCLSQFLRRVEAEHYHCHVLFVDTHSINISEEAELVASIYGCTILPVSAGSPQEMSFVESKVRTLAKHSTAQMLGAPHLGPEYWALSDLYAVYTRQFLPQATRGNHASFFLRTGKVINWKTIFLHVWGCPMHYVPGDGPIHKRGAVCDTGTFVGVQHPMVLVRRESDKKVMSVSMKKCFPYEAQYLTELDSDVSKADIEASLQDKATQQFPTPEHLPARENSQVDDRPPKINRGGKPHLSDELIDHGRRLETLRLDGNSPAGRDKASVEEDQRDTHGQKSHGFANAMGQRHLPPVTMRQVQSVKSLRQHRFSEPIQAKPTTKLDRSAVNGNYGNLEGEDGEYVANIHDDKIKIAREDIERAKEAVLQSVPSVTMRRQVIAKLRQAGELMSNQAVQKGALKIGKKRRAGTGSDPSMVSGKRKLKKTAKAKALEEDKATKKSLEIRSADASEATARKKKVRKGDLVSCASTLFDGNSPGSFSDDHPDRCYGVAINGVKNGLIKVKFDEDGEIHDIRTRDLKIEYEKITAATIVVLLAQGGKVAYAHKGNEKMPKNFFELLRRPDWREWVQAVKRELEGWDDNDATTLVNIADVPPTAKVVPLGELYSVKRDGRYKYRQYLMGNLLREGIDYLDTFSTTISGPGVCTFYSLATTCEKKVHGWDAVCGYLQVKEQNDLYAFLPSHQEYSALTYEEIYLLRKELLQLVEKEGEQGFKSFVTKQKRESRVNPKQVLRLNSCIYGSPEAGHAFEMLMHSVHTETCGLTQTQPEPSMFVRIIVDDKDRVVGYVIVIAWTDDVRFFGTDRELEQYKKGVQSRMKVTFEMGPVAEFVSIETHQDLVRKLTELKMPKYWVKARQQFKDLFAKGVKERKIPLAVADEKIAMTKATPEEIEEAKHLPFLQLLGVISYPASNCKFEMRYVVSVLGSNRGGWSKRQFWILMKAFEYGYTTRDMGLIYSKGLDPHGINVLYSYCDSSHGVPRSQGCRIVMLNGAAVTFKSQKHHLSAPSTCVDEMIELYEGSTDVLGLRNVMAELGMYQEDPTRIYQDNKSTIQIANHRGSLGPTSRAIDLKHLAVRNRIEDHQVCTQYCPTPIMRADMGTKALPEAPFCCHRDIMNGYSLVKAAFPEKELPSYVMVGNSVKENLTLASLMTAIMAVPTDMCEQL